MCEEILIKAKIGTAVQEHQERKRQENERTAQERKEFGEQLHSLRKDMRLSRRSIAEKVGCSESTIKRLENGDPVRDYNSKKVICTTVLRYFHLEAENKLLKSELEEAIRQSYSFISEPPDTPEIYEDEDSIVTIKSQERGYFDGKL